LGRKLIEIAQQFKELQSIASVQPGDNPSISALKAKALEAINNGKLDNADMSRGNSDATSIAWLSIRPIVMVTAVELR